MNILQTFNILGNIEAIRPVSFILAGIILMMTVWRIHKHMASVTSLILITGAVILAINFCIILPAYEAKLIIRTPQLYTHPNASVELIHMVETISNYTLNVGWFILGLGMTLLPKNLSNRKR